jgi:hypothetical protein
LFTKLNEIKEVMSRTTQNSLSQPFGDMGPLFVAVMGGLWTWLGYQGEVVFANHLTNFWKATGSFLSIGSGIFAAVYAGKTTVEAAVKSEYWKSTSVYKGANFLSYGNNAVMSSTLGVFEVMWVIAYLGLGIEIAVMPYIIDTASDKYYAKSYAKW